MFKIDISGAVFEAEKVEIKNQRLFIDGVDQGSIGFTFVSKVIEGEYEFTKKNNIVRWTSK